MHNTYKYILIYTYICIYIYMYMCEYISSKSWTLYVNSIPGANDNTARKAQDGPNTL